MTTGVSADGDGQTDAVRVTRRMAAGNVVLSSLGPEKSFVPFEQVKEWLNPDRHEEKQEPMPHEPIQEPA